MSLRYSISLPYVSGTACGYDLLNPQSYKPQFRAGFVKFPSTAGRRVFFRQKSWRPHVSWWDKSQFLCKNKCFYLTLYRMREVNIRCTERSAVSTTPMVLEGPKLSPFLLLTEVSTRRKRICSIGGIITAEENWSPRWKTCASAPSFTTNITRTDLVLNPAFAVTGRRQTAWANALS